MHRLFWLISLFIFGIAAPVSGSPIFSLGAEDSSKYLEAKAVASPVPRIPAQLEAEGFKSSCVARFIIQANGKTKVTLISSSGNQEADDIVLETLKRWQFKPATLNGEPIASSRKIIIEFEVM